MVQSNKAEMKTDREFSKSKTDTVKCTNCGSLLIIARPQAPSLLEQNRELKEALRVLHQRYLEVYSSEFGGGDLVEDKEELLGRDTEFQKAEALLNKYK